MKVYVLIVFNNPETKVLGVYTNEDEAEIAGQVAVKSEPYVVLFDVVEFELQEKA